MSNDVKSINFAELEPQASQNGKALFNDGDLSLVEHVKVDLTVRLGDVKMTIGELFNLKQGEVIQLNQSVETPIQLYMKDQLIAYGKLVAVDDFLGFQILKIES